MWNTQFLNPGIDTSQSYVPLNFVLKQIYVYYQLHSVTKEMVCFICRNCHACVLYRRKEAWRGTRIGSSRASTRPLCTTRRCLWSWRPATLAPPTSRPSWPVWRPPWRRYQHCTYNTFPEPHTLHTQYIV